MAHKIDTDTCVKCGVCEDSCPTRCIAVNDDGDYVVDDWLCIDCGVCAADCCVDAITEE